MQNEAMRFSTAMAAGPHEGERTVAYIPTSGFVPPSPEKLTARLPNLEVTEILVSGGIPSRVGRQSRVGTLSRLHETAAQLFVVIHFSNLTSGSVPSWAAI